MSKTYKHKTLGWIAKEYSGTVQKYLGYYSIFKDINGFATILENNNPKTSPDKVFLMYPELIENSQDREEVIDNDWIDEAIKDFDDNKVDTWDVCFRKAVEKNCPKHKMFTEEEIEKHYIEYERRYVDIVCRFLQAHGLLLSTNND